MSALHLALLGVALFALAVHAVVVGMRDAPNAAALPVRSRALTPRAALWLAALMNLVGGVISGGLTLTATAEILSVVPRSIAGLAMLTVAVVVATAWGLFAWWRAMPISSTHALSAAVVGAALALAITQDIPDPSSGVRTELLVVAGALLLSPAVAWGLSWLLVTPLVWASRDAAPGSVNDHARMALAVAGAANALGHGAQIGLRLSLVATLMLRAAGLPEAVGWWIPVLSGVVLGAGTLLGGWRIAHTLTERLVHLDPLRSAVAAGVSAALLFVGSFALHLPLSTTHTAVAGIVGAGQRQRYTAVRWPQVIRVAVYWVTTLVVCLVVSLLIAAAVSPLF